MVRGNWQRRVEKNEARRDEAKQRKHRMEEKKLFKQKAQKFLTALDEYKDIAWQQVEKRWELHLWVDTLPSDQDQIQPAWEEDSDQKGSKRRNRSSSIESEGAAKFGKSKGGKGKKKHPRSKEVVDEAPAEEASITPQLSQKYFFKGQQEQRKGGKKGGGSSHMQVPKGFKSLAEVILKGAESKQYSKDVLASTASAHPDAPGDDEANTGETPMMEMLYYFSVPAADGVAGGEMPSFSEFLGGILSNKSCNIGSIVYVTFNGTLLFDRYQEGLLLSENDLRNCISMGKSATSSSQTSSNLAKSMPGSVLEYILTFLSEFEIAGMSSVCKGWNKEIGKESGNLWRHCLERRQWPVDTSTDLEHAPYRQTFLSHYGVMRDSNAIQLGISDMLIKKSSSSNEVVSRAFETSKDTPQHPNYAAGIAVWSENQVIVAYSHECTLRLFSTTEKSGSDGDKLCRELICQNIDPYRNTKKKSSTLVDLALDDSRIGCLCKIEEENVEEKSTHLLFLNRDEFLTSDVADEEEILQQIGLEKAILDFLLDYDGIDDDPMEFLSYISSGGEIEDVEVLVSPSLVACANGLFLFHASWSIPSETGVEGEARFFKKLFMFSAGAGAIVLMQSIGSSTMNEAHESYALASQVTTDEKGVSHCTFAASSAVSLSLTIGFIDANGATQTYTPIMGTIPEGYSLCQRRRRPMAMVGSTTIVADAMVENTEDESNKTYKSILSFNSYSASASSTLSSTVDLKGNLKVTDLVGFRHEHVLVLCHLHPRTGDTDIDAIDGHWFGPPAEDGLMSLVGIVYHVPSQTEIHRVVLLGDQLGIPVPLAVTVHGDTVAGSVWWKGLLMTGEDVRARQEDCTAQEPPTPTSKAKKKKKKTPKKGGKKDGFARGMSMRG
mmetsp:Transcript_45123/g.109179  ORF Transcript_45123/g.109179 Transcript_45123/m.109179 type:complete len:892 (-) Transcript_45123:70-2745(-)|eukprot:CAMPEP_0113619306 /NCGR_PEP_ID=MMETSP0017_2-20120614/9801_1 /TAXON_ID=2856 /ORGANISM="Cylindrotheca closterium" /LENGTH=891 /DNA_ID=CAMNT_0000528875 /DNA_START=23 /DNA_END=2698 /DNA_ORIENTATION=- /assembly_acc=CAM_ASM_000147